MHPWGCIDWFAVGRVNLRVYLKGPLGVLTPNHYFYLDFIRLSKRRAQDPRQILPHPASRHRQARARPKHILCATTAFTVHTGGVKRQADQLSFLLAQIRAQITGAIVGRPNDIVHPNHQFVDAAAAGLGNVGP
jgi:hypothetical protein